MRTLQSKELSSDLESLITYVSWANGSMSLSLSFLMGKKKWG